MRFIATCKLGLESVVKGELMRLGIEIESTEDARVIFKGDYSDMAMALYNLRAAERLLLVVGSFTAKTFDELFEGVKALDLKTFLKKDAVIHVNGKSAKSTLFSVSDCQSITKKAIVENLKAAYNTHIIPETGKKVIVEVGLLRDEVTLALDACGAGLSRRGYRTYNVAAPISETLGAAMVLLSRHKPDMPFLDPMCGSGTLPIEAAMIAQNRAPGLLREFAAQDWPFIPADIWARTHEKALDEVRDVKITIEGADIDARNIDLCKKHAKKAGVMLSWAVRSVENTPPMPPRGVLLCNPPYGERLMDKRDVERLYLSLKKTTESLPDWAVGVITSMRDFERVFGKRANKRRKLSNGGMPCTFYQYFAPRTEREPDIYNGKDIDQ